MTLSAQKALLIEQIADAIRGSGWQVIFENNEHPTRLLAFNGSDRRPLLVYVWRITPGGPAGVRPTGEIRIQLTGVTPPFQRSNEFQTLLLGYFEEEDIFVGYDVSRRPQSWGSSPSVQLRMSAIEDARTNGFGFYSRHTRSNSELAIAFRPDSIMDYVIRQSALHGFAGDPEATAALQSATQDVAGGRDTSINLDAISGQGRREAVRTVVERVGQQNFRARVLAVYEHHCAACATQLNLLDAAHIVPVPGGGTNETTNGLSLCKLHHAAYDCGLVGIFPDYSIVVNEAEAQRLARSGRIGGLQAFREHLRHNLREAARAQDRPSPDYLSAGLLLRGWRGIIAPVRNS
jgi:putative restriction endonuclease